MVPWWGLREGAGRPSERVNIPKPRSATRGLRWRRGSAGPQGVAPALELGPLDGVRAERDGAIVRHARGIRVPRAAEQVRSRGVEWLVPGEARIRRELGEDGEARARAAPPAPPPRARRRPRWSPRRRAGPPALRARRRAARSDPSRSPRRSAR